MIMRSSASNPPQGVVMEGGGDIMGVLEGFGGSVEGRGK